MSQSVAEILDGLDACAEAIEWARPYGTNRHKAWAECQDGEGMLWLLGRLAGKIGSADRRKLVLCCCEVARLAPPCKQQEQEQARLKCLETAERWGKGDADITPSMVASAAVAATGSAYSNNVGAVTAWAVNAAHAAAYAVYAVAAHWAADVVRDVAEIARIEGRKEVVLASIPDIVRKHYPKPPKVGRRPSTTP